MSRSDAAVRDEVAIVLILESYFAIIESTSLRLKYLLFFTLLLFRRKRDQQTSQYVISS